MHFDGSEGKSLTILIIIIQLCCVDLYKRCDCGKSTAVTSWPKSHDRIIGGVDYTSHKYPWLAALQLNGSFLCGGSVISDQYVLSAAHCLSNRFDQNLLKVILGEHNRCEPDIRTTIFSVNKVLKHENFNTRDFSGDIMLIKLSMRLTFNKFVKPICLPKFAIRQGVVNKYAGKSASVVGWGKRHPQSSHASCLPQELQVPILDKKQCSSYLRHSLFCAGFLEGGQDSCQGDSGGPLQILTRRNTYQIIGIVSSGIGCALANHPGLYTDVLRHLPWIWKQTEGSVYCF